MYVVLNWSSVLSGDPEPYMDLLTIPVSRSWLIETRLCLYGPLDS